MYETKDFVLVVLGVVLGVPAAVYVNRLQRPLGKILAYGQRGQSVLTPRGENLVGDDLSLAFRGRRLPRLTVTALTLWNAGDDTVFASEIAPADTLKILLEEDGEIVNALIDREPWPACALAVKLAEDGRSASVTFDYLNPGEGGIIRVLHTGKKPKLAFRGSLRGAKLLSGDQLVKQKTRFVVAIRAGTMILGMGSILGAAFALRTSMSPAWVFAGGILAFPLLVVFLFVLVDRYFNVLPKELSAPDGEAFENVLYRIRG